MARRSKQKRSRRSGGGTKIVVRRSSPPRRRSSGGGGVSTSVTKQKVRQRVLTLGGLTSFAFGLLQSKLQLPSIPNVPDSLTYGAAGVAIGVLAKSDVILDCSTGPLLAGLHNFGLRGFSEELGGEFDEVAGEGDDEVAGEGDDEVAGEFDDVVAGDFDEI